MFPLACSLARILAPSASQQVGATFVGSARLSLCNPSLQKSSQAERKQATSTSPFNSVIKSRQKINSALKDTVVNLPVKPKKPYTAWVAFVLDRKDALMRNEKMTAVELSIRLAQEWKQTDKSDYLNDYKRRREEFDRKLEEFKNSITQSDKDLIESNRALLKQRKSINQLSRTKPPKLPANPANFYIKDRLKQADMQEKLKTNKVSELFKILFNEYRSLRPEEKEKYIQMRQEDKLRFIDEFNNWYHETKNNPKLNKLAKKQADTMYARVKALYYI